MSRYLKDPIILFSTIAWVIAFVVFCSKVNSFSNSAPSQSSVPSQTSAQSSGQSQAAANNPASGATSFSGTSSTSSGATGSSGSPANPPSPASNAVNSLGSGAGTNTATTGNTAITPPGTTLLPPTTGSTSGVILHPLVRHIPGQISVGAGPNQDTDDINVALKQVAPDEKIVLSAGSFSVDNYPIPLTPEHMTIIGAGEKTSVRLHSSSINVKGATRIENLVLEGPVGTSTFWVSGTGILTLKNVTLRDSAFGVSIDQSGKLYADGLKVEKVDSFCVSLANQAKAQISGSSFSDCFVGVRIENMGKVSIYSSSFHYNNFAVQIMDDRNHADCNGCSFESVQNKTNVDSRLTVTEKLIDKPAEKE